MAADLRPLQPGDADYIARWMRSADRAEAWMMLAMRADVAVAATVSSAREVWTGTWDGEPACILGVSGRTVSSDVGVPWLISTRAVELHGLALLRRSAAVVERMRQHYERMENYVHPRNTHAVGWLRWLGFAIDQPRPIGPFGVRFSRFHMGF